MSESRSGNKPTGPPPLASHVRAAISAHSAPVPGREPQRASVPVPALQRRAAAVRSRAPHVAAAIAAAGTSAQTFLRPPGAFDPVVQRSKKGGSKNKNQGSGDDELSWRQMCVLQALVALGEASSWSSAKTSFQGKDFTEEEVIKKQLTQLKYTNTSTLTVTNAKRGQGDQVSDSKGRNSASKTLSLDLGKNKRYFAIFKGGGSEEHAIAIFTDNKKNVSTYDYQGERRSSSDPMPVGTYDLYSK